MILASKSPRRREILTKAGFKFRIYPSPVAEKTEETEPGAVVRSLALQKASAVADLFPDEPVLGSDTVVYCKREILGKPKDAADAFRLLSLQNNSWQEVYTGVALVWRSRNIAWTESDVSRCKARELGEEELRVLSFKHLDKAGAYAVQDKDDGFIEKIEGRFDTIVGLSMNLVYKFMRKAGLK